MGRGAGGRGRGGGAFSNVISKLPEAHDKGAVFKVLPDDEYEAELTQHLFAGDVEGSNATYISEARAQRLAEIHERNPEIYPQGSPGPGIYIRASALEGTRDGWLSMEGSFPNAQYIPVHEYSHAVDMERGFSVSTAWRAAVQSDANWVLRNPGGALDPNIDFAEDFAAAVPGFIRYPGQFREHYPARAGFLESRVIR